jgi:hypothetical protein
MVALGSVLDLLGGQQVELCRSAAQGGCHSRIPFLFASQSASWWRMRGAR